MDYKEAIGIFENEIKKLNTRPIHVNHIGDAEKADDAMKTAISAMQELQQLHDQGFSLDRMKDIDFRKEIVEHINYDAFMRLKDELEEYKQIGTLEGVREAMEKQNECKDCGYKNHSDRISELNSCNDCGLANICEKRPEYGQYCRINCYDWRCMNER